MKNTILTAILSTFLLIGTGCSSDLDVISSNQPNLIETSLKESETNSEILVVDEVSVLGNMSDMSILKCLSLTFDQRKSLKNIFITEKRLQKTIMSGFYSRELNLTKKYNNDVKYCNSLDTTEIALESMLINLRNKYDYELIILRNDKKYHIEESNQRIYLALEAVLTKEQLEIWNKYKITGKLPCAMTEK